MAKTAILLCARLGSSRLPRKHLQEVAGKPVFQWLLERIQHEFRAEIDADEAVVAIATSDEPENEDFKCFNDIGVEVYQGVLTNIPLRFRDAAVHFKAETIVAVDGDDILCSPKAMRLVMEALRSGKPYVATRDLPFGMNAWGFSTQYLSDALQGLENDVLETGWGRIFDEADLTELETGFDMQDERLRLTLDYEEDLEFFRAVIEGLQQTATSASDTDIVRLALDDDLVAINAHRMESYRANFSSEVEKEDATNS